MLVYAKKAFTAAGLSCITVMLAWNMPGWIDGSAAFEWRSVLAGLIGAFWAGLGTYYVTNGPPKSV